MTSSRIRTSAARWGVALGAGLLALSQTARGEDRPVALLSVGAPEGFAELDGPQAMIVDVYYRGERLGQTAISARPGSFRFTQPGDLVGLIPDLIDTPEVRERFADALPAHEGLVCSSGRDRSHCGRLAPGQFGAILDRDRFRLDLFLGGDFESVHLRRPSPYLPDPGSGLSLVNAMAGVVSGGSGRSAALSLQDRLILASGNARLRSDLFYSREHGVQTDQAYAELDVDDWRYAAGLLFAPGTDLVGRRKLVGFGIASQLDTRIDREALFGSPLPVTLGERARVEIVHNGRVLASQVFQPGSHQLDTSTLPDGSYEVTIRISEIGAPIREETRFFAKTARIAPVGRDLAFAYGGFVARENATPLGGISGRPYFQAGYAHRWDTSLASDVTFVATGSAGVAQVGGNLLLGNAQIRVAGLATSQGGYGGVLQVGLRGDGPFSLALDVRKVALAAGGSIDGLDPELAGASRSLADDIVALRARDTSFTQITGFAGYGQRNRQFGLSFSARKQDSAQLSYSLGPTMRWDLVQRGPVRVSFNADGGFTDRGRSGFVGLSLSLAGPWGSTTNRAGLRYSTFEKASAELTPVASLTGSARFGGVAGGALEIGGGLDAETDRRLLNLSGRLDGERLAITSDIVQDLRGGSQYALGLRTTFTASGGTVAFQGAESSQAAVLVRVSGGRRDDRYEVLVDESVAATASDGETRTLALSPYRSYAIRIRPLGGKAVAYDAQSRTVALSPGTVAKLEWSARPLAILFGRLVTPTGKPAGFALLTSGQSISETDANGYFQIEAAPGAELAARLSDGRICTVELPQVSSDEDFTKIGTLVCRETGFPAATVVARAQGDEHD